MEEKKGYWKWIIALLVLLLLLISSQSLGIIDLDLESHGHGDTYKSGFSSLLISLGILEDYDYIDKFTGDTYCFDDACWGIADDVYATCLAEFGDDPICDDEYMEYLITECPVRCEEEVYVWDGTPVIDIGAFSETAFPDFYGLCETRCNSFIWDGIWISQPDKIGCENSFFIFCDSNSMTSAAEVCTTIGKVWECSFTEATCSEP